jgi:hypothetical protein
MRTMGFNKTGVAPIEGVKCSCGHEIKGHVSSCPGCGKTLVPDNLQTKPTDPPPDKEESKVK